MKNNKLNFYTRGLYFVFSVMILSIGGCKWNSDYRSRIQPNSNPQALTAEEAQLQDVINESEPDSLKFILPSKPLPPVPDLPL